MADMLTELERHLAGMHPLSHELAARCSHRFSTDHALCSDTYRHYTHVQDARTVEASDWLKQLLAAAKVDADAAARASEREGIARAIEAVRSPSLSATENGHLEHAARIARNYRQEKADG